MPTKGTAQSTDSSAPLMEEACAAPGSNRSAAASAGSASHIHVCFPFLFRISQATHPSASAPAHTSKTAGTGL